MDLHEATTPPQTDEENVTAWEATFKTTAISSADDVFVTVPGYDGDVHEFGPVMWSPRQGPTGLVYPHAGDEALVVQADSGQWWVLEWTPAYPAQPARDRGPFSVTATAPIAPGAERTETVTHSLGLSAGQITAAVVRGHLFDGIWSHRCSWRVGSITANTVAIVFFNLGPAGTDAQPGLKFTILA